MRIIKALKEGASHVAGAFRWTLWALAIGCTPALDVLGVEETVTESEQTAPERLSDKHPEYDAQRTIEETFDGCTLTLNKSASVTRLTIQSSKDDDRDFAGVIFPTRAEALVALGSRHVIPSMEVVNGALKPFNDGLMAAVELASETGANGALVNKRALFQALLARMLERAALDLAAREAAVDFGAAALLGETSTLGSDIASESARAVRDFEGRVAEATPIGFYTSSDALSRIFRRDRFLQTALSYAPTPFARAHAVTRALSDAPELAAQYQRVLDLGRGLTNPSRHFAPPELADVTRKTSEASAAEAEFQTLHPELSIPAAPCRAGYSWLPASDSPERKVLSAQYCANAPPPNLLDAVIDAIRAGAVDLTPTATSGWYDHQLYALETLLAPERAAESEHLLLTKEYRAKLVETFKSLLIQTRETHVKQLEMVAVRASAPPPPIDVYPLLPIEPFPTFYLRTARAYAFVHNVLALSMGAEWLQSTSRLREDGGRWPMSLAQELDDKARLLYGLHRVAAASIGMGDAMTAEERVTFDPATTERAARTWLESWQQDPDVLVDPRVAVPMVLDSEEKVSRNLGVVGVKVLRMHATFPEGYEPKVEAGFCEVRDFVPFEPYLLVEQSLEFARPLALPPLTRDEFRARLADVTTIEHARPALESP